MKNFWVDPDLLSNRSGIGRDSKKMLETLENEFQVKFVDWPSLFAADSKYRRKILLALRLVFGTKVALPGRYRGGFYQSQLGPVIPGLSMSVWVVRLHDLFPASNPEWFRWWASKIFKSSLNLAVERNAIFLCDSRSTEIELRRLYPSHQILSFVIPCRLPSDLPKYCEHCGACQFVSQSLPKDFFLSVGTIEPRKNYSSAILAWNTLAKYPSFESKLIIVGRAGWKTNALQSSLLESRGVGINWLYDCCDGALETLYANCKGLISFSHAEGFDLPPMEARQRHGKPLILSDIPVHREFHDGTAAFFKDEISLVNILNHTLQSSNPSNYDEEATKTLNAAMTFIDSVL